MNVTDHCRNCLKGLAEKTVNLSSGGERLLSYCCQTIDDLMGMGKTPPAISNLILKRIGVETGVLDPFQELKEEEPAAAREAFERILSRDRISIEEAFRTSAMGNSGDFFVSDGYDGGPFRADMAEIAEAIYNKGTEVLLLGDNIGDFIFDKVLVGFLEARGKVVYYAVKERPVQNDISVKDVVGMGLTDYHAHIISTGTDEVGIRREAMKGLVGRLWDSDAVVIAKGMGHYETMSEYTAERPVIHVMKVKCPAVALSVNEPVGTNIAMIGGERNG